MTTYLPHARPGLVRAARARAALAARKARPRQHPLSIAYAEGERDAWEDLAYHARRHATYDALRATLLEGVSEAADILHDATPEGGIDDSALTEVYCYAEGRYEAGYESISKLEWHEEQNA